jgi:phosphonatase-like hydrolase
VEDRGDVPALLRDALAHYEVASTPEEIAKWRGASKREIIRHFVDRATLQGNTTHEKLAEAIYAEFSQALIAVYRSVPPIAGAEDAIRRLRGRGYLVAATTGFERTVTTSILQRLGWQQYFAAVICSDDVAQGRPSPYMLFHAMEVSRVDSVAEVVTVGDTPLDMQAGANAGVRGVVGVLSGASTVEKLRAEPHTHILPSVASLPELLSAKF